MQCKFSCKIRTLDVSDMKQNRNPYTGRAKSRKRLQGAVCFHIWHRVLSDYSGGYWKVLVKWPPATHAVTLPLTQRKLHTRTVQRSFERGVRPFLHADRARIQNWGKFCYLFSSLLETNVLNLIRIR
jgi:hypothetical protein